MNDFSSFIHASDLKQECKKISKKHHSRPNVSLNCICTTIQQRSYEDTHFTFPENYDPDVHRLKFFLVCDGHGCGQSTIKIPNIICFGMENPLTNVRPLHEMIAERIRHSEYDVDKVDDAILESFEEMDRAIYSAKIIGGSCVALVLVLDERYIFAAHVGDSKIAIFEEKNEIIYESKDHGGSNWEEIKRIRDLGGWFSCGRVNGTIMITKSIGDFDIGNHSFWDSEYPAEKKIISPIPSIYRIDMLAEEEKGNEDVDEDEELPKKKKVYKALLTSDAPYEFCNCTIESLFLKLLSVEGHKSNEALDDFNKIHVTSSTTDDSTLLFVSEL